MGVLADMPVRMQICHNIFEGITAAQQSAFETIYAVFSDLPEPKSQALEALHQVCPDVPIHLLIRMHEEPLALELYRVSPWAKSVLDYLICPVSCRFLETQPTSGQQQFDTEQVSDMSSRIEELAKLAVQDDLTGVKNRRYLRQFLPTILQQASDRQCQVTLLLFDIDDFKHYNDAYGHSVGDDVLRQTAKLIRCCCRNQDVVARLGGDEFAVIFWDIPEKSVKQNPSDRRKPSQDHPRQALFMAHRFRKEMSETPFDHLGPHGRGSLTISGGMATFPMDAETPEDLFEKADQAMLEAKRNGKNRITLVGQPSQ